MAEYQITSWREIPSLVTARDGDETAKVPLPQRFADAIDDAAMRTGAIASDAYLEGWNRGPWVAGAGTPAELAAEVAARLDAEHPADAMQAMLEALGPLPEEG